MEEEVVATQGAPEWWRILLIVVLIFLSALFSGLTLGLMGLDCNNLELFTLPPFESAEAERDAQFAKRILPVRRRGNHLLCTLLLGNVAVNSLLSILMADITSGLMGFFISTAAIVIFGEIAPQALCSRHGLRIGYYSLPIVYIFIILLYILAKPISWILDKCLGEEIGLVYSKDRMQRLFEMYQEQKLLDAQETKFLKAILEFGKRKAADIMTPIEAVYMVEIDQVIDRNLLKTIYAEKYSRIPVYERDRQKVVGMLMVRDLILINPDTQLVTIRQLQTILLRSLHLVESKSGLEPILHFFKKGNAHMTIVYDIILNEGHDPTPVLKGIITLEDIIEEIIQEEIEDEQEGKGADDDRAQLKDKLDLFFWDHSADKMLSDTLIRAIASHIRKEIPAFDRSILKKSILKELIKKAEIVEITSDLQPFRHTLKLTQTFKEKKMTTLIQYASKDREEKLLESPQGFSQIKKPAQGKVEEEAQDIRESEIDIDVPPEKIYEEIKKDMDQETKDKYLKQTINPVIFIKGVPTDKFYFIVRGKVAVCAGSEGFIVDRGEFSHLGQDALTHDDFIPDYSAKVIGAAVLLKISRLEYRQAISQVENVTRNLGVFNT